MNIADLDRELSRWQQASGTIVTNIYDLYEHPTYRALAEDARQASPKITGLTKARTAGVPDDVTMLLTRSLALKEAVDRATGLRKTMPPIFQAERIRQIEEILTGASIHLDTIDMPLAQKGLMVAPAAPVATVTLQQLLDGMTPKYESAKTAILAVDDAWSRLARQLGDAGMEADALLKKDPSLPELTALKSRLAECQNRMMSDPLQCVETLDQELAPLLRQTQERVDQSARDRVQFTADLTAADQIWTQTKQLHARAVGVYQERTLKTEVEGAADAPPPVEEHLIDDLGLWLGKLHETAEAGMWRPARVGLGKWKTLAEKYSARDAYVIAASQAILDRRIELRGWLDALKAKAAACGMAEDSELCDLGRLAKELLFRRPTPMSEAERQVSEYNSRLNSKHAD